MDDIPHFIVIGSFICFKAFNTIKSVGNKNAVFKEYSLHRVRFLKLQHNLYDESYI